MNNLTILSKITIMSLVSILVLFIISKILGKRQIAQLEFMDYVIGISIGSIASEMATDIGDKPIWAYIYSMLIYLVVDVLFMLISRTTPRCKHFFKGKPVTLIKGGKINYEMLNKSKLDVNDLLAMLRNKNFFDIRNVDMAVLENNGNLSVLPSLNYTKLSSQTLPIYLVVDGRVVFDNLQALNKDTKWLFSSIKIDSENKLDNILLAIYDKTNNSFTIYTKNAS